MNPSTAVYRGMKQAKIDLVTSVPCVNLQELLGLVESDPEIIHVPVTREEEGIGICAGAYLGGKRPAIMMQNSGLGNSINALASLDLLYQIPLLMIVSHRGGKGETIVGQVPMGKLTPGLLDVMGISWVAPKLKEAEETVARAWEEAEAEGTPAALLLDIEFWRSE
ncbi:MAG: sulfopyruvate decarboxylase subunit alpha [Methanotrichaceae archaeon]